MPSLLNAETTSRSRERKSAGGFRFCSGHLV